MFNIKNASVLVCFVLIGCCWTSEAVQPDDELLERLSHLKNNSQFCAFMGMEDNCTELLDDVIPVDENKMVVSGAEESKIALFDACNPREQTIALPRHPDSDITIWPFCTRALRCGGCCTSDVFSCEPTETRDRFVKIFETRLPYKGSQRFIFLGVKAVKIIEHVQCDAQCKTKAHECHRFQMYEERKCRCTCRPERLKLKDSCHKGQIWDDTECDCICPNRATTNCPEPSYFNSDTCKCTLKTGVNGEIDLDKLFAQIDSGLLSPTIFKPEDEVDKYLNTIGDWGEQGDGSFTTTTLENPDEPSVDVTTLKPTTSETSTSTTTSTTTTTTVPTTTTPVPTPEPCLLKCFGVWKPIRMPSGSCQCMPPRRFPYKSDVGSPSP